MKYLILIGYEAIKVPLNTYDNQLNLFNWTYCIFYWRTVSRLVRVASSTLSGGNSPGFRESAVIMPLYAVEAQTSLAPLSWFHGSRVTTAHAHQCCIFQSYAKTMPSWNWQKKYAWASIHDNGHRRCRFILAWYEKHFHLHNYTEWPRRKKKKNGTAYFPQCLDAITGISVCEVTSPEKNYSTITNFGSVVFF